MQVAGFTNSNIQETIIYNEQLKSLKLKYRILQNFVLIDLII